METLLRHFFKYEFVYIFLFISISLFVTGVFIKRSINKTILLSLFSVFFTLSVMEFILSFSYPVLKYSDLIQYKKIFADRPEGEYRHTYIIDQNNQIKECFNHKNTHNHEKIIFDVFYSFENKIRYTKCNVDSKEKYIFMGCSYTFGHGLHDNETLPYYFSELMNFDKNILNFGIPGFSSNTALNIIKSGFITKYIQEDDKIINVVFSLHRDHINRNFRFVNGDVWVYKGGKFKANKQPFGLAKKIFVRSYIFNKIFLYKIDEYNDEFYQNYMISSLKEMQYIVQHKYNSEFIVIIWPEFKDNFIEKLKETDLNMIFLPEYMENFVDEYKIPYDGHPNAKANKEIADILIKYINGGMKNE